MISRTRYLIKFIQFSCPAYILCALGVLLIFPLDGHAQNFRQQNHANKQLNGRSLVKEYSTAQRTSRLTPRQRFTNDSQQSLSLQLKLDSADAFVDTPIKQSNSLKFYRSLVHFKYFRDWAGLDTYDELDSNSVAKHMLLYQSAKTLLDLAVKSPTLGRLYSKAKVVAKEFRDKTTVNVQQSGTGSLNVNPGVSNNGHLLELKLSVSARGGAGPVISFEDNLRLRHNLFDASTLLEYYFDF